MNTHMKTMTKTMNNIIKMLNTNISFLVFICGSILPCIQLYRYYIRKSIDIWGNKIG